MNLDFIRYHMKLLSEDVASVIIEEFLDKELIGEIHPDAGFLPSKKFDELINELIQVHIDEMKKIIK